MTHSLISPEALWQAPAGAALVASAHGALEVIVDRPEPASAAPCGLALVAHPQPLLGGSARHKVPQVLARGLAEAGWLALRPNFRGVGRSTGAHAGGEGEAEDLLALAQALRAAGPGAPLALVGFSFGAHVTARVAAALAAGGQAAQAVVLAGMPDGVVPAGRAYDSPGSFDGELVLHGAADEVVPLPLALAWARRHDKAVTVLPEADHFFAGQLPLLRRLVVRHVAAAVPP
ncbi:alpha/beta hydrolase [Ideonella livida]|uniref:Alpha/beta fold hydrolase n=1 Tax=Ideonella livida TaxID=2707176 RepID=A0A7C9TMY8_9BURK|nr:alpha/beta fold hydrolase [Ideonella livida]NDY92046.1 alpha/beta fold hydrolase [Ideonella livida]